MSADADFKPSRQEIWPQLDQVGKHPDFRAAAASLRWILIHMIEETARHAGHPDAIRELLDGRKGYY